MVKKSGISRSVLISDQHRRKIIRVEEVLTTSHLSLEDQLKKMTFENNQLRSQIAELITEKERFKILIAQYEEEIEKWRIQVEQIDININEESETRVRDLMSEIESWRTRYLNMEEAKNKEIRELKFQLKPGKLEVKISEI